LIEKLTEHHPLHSAIAKQWVADRLLIPFEWQDECKLVSPRVPFVSSPEEWCDAQLLDAAILTLTLLECANESGADLKDASAWNVIFKGCHPVFCDLTSFETLQTHVWWAAGQFVRHFISPLWLARTTGLQARDMFHISRDGVLPEVVRNTLGWRRFLSRCWPLVAEAKGGPSVFGVPGIACVNTPQYRRKLVTSLRWMLDGVKPRMSRQTVWGHYTDQRSHYTSPALQAKRELVMQWLTHLKPDWTLDLGCNSGEFSQLAIDVGSRVIALDGDHDAVQTLYLKNRGNDRIYPVLASLDDIHAGRGWGGDEHKGLSQRLNGSADVVLMLALIHHLSISAAVHMDEIARFAASCTRRWLIIEWLEPSDPQVQQLCSQRRRKPDEFAVARQRKAFVDAGFVLREEVPLPQEQRYLALLEKTL
jgi:SAM-dependent methyltransferase